MKVLYGIQCTGNGHITRSIDLVQELRKYVEVDVLTSGSHSEVKFPFDVKYIKKGLSFTFGKNGSFDLRRTIWENNPLRFLKEVKEVPVGFYDMVISDFEPITAWSAKKNWIYSVAVSNQAALLDPSVTKPSVISPLSKLLIRNFCPKKTYGLFYKKLNSGLYYPPIRKSVLRLKPYTGNYYAVYLPFYGHDKLIKHLRTFKNENWVVFSKYIDREFTIDNVNVQPVNDKRFLKALEGCKGVLCSAGFGTTSEALYLKKKLLIIPMKNQYEQQCNAYALEQFGIPVLKSLKQKHHAIIDQWLSSNQLPDIEIKDESGRLVRAILEDFINHKIQVQGG